MSGRLVLLLGLAMTSAASAQAPDSCLTGTAQVPLSNPQLEVQLFNTGGLFFGGTATSGDGYLIPKATGNSPFFAAGLWLGGKVGGELRVAGARFGNYHFWPGSLGENAQPPSDCAVYDRIYTVSREDIVRYYATGELADDLRDWPHVLGAPVMDGDGDPTNYNLSGGDQPSLIGERAAWWVMQDASHDHPNGTAPLGVEVRAHAFVYGGAREATSPAVSQTLFIRYQVTNRRGTPIDSMYASMWADPDLGDASDDYIGSDTLRNMAYVYNKFNEDVAYGTPPPAQGIQVLDGPIGLANGRDDDRDGQVDERGERLRATATTSFLKNPNAGNEPFTPQGYFNYMKGLWRDGTPVYDGWNGYQQPHFPVTTFPLAGDPVAQAFWSDMNYDGAGTRALTGDRRMAISTGPFRLAPDSSATVLYAFPFGQGTDNLNSVAVMRGYAAALQRLYAEGFFASSPVERPERSFELALARVRPNPSSGAAEAMLTLPDDAHVRAVVIDVLGRQLAVLADGELAKGETILQIPDGLAPGTYLLRVRVEPGGEETLTFTVAR
ncbi:MAG: hypothetical protein AAF170_16215 [Bacteroidota bacterium]